MGHPRRARRDHQDGQRLTWEGSPKEQPPSQTARPRPPAPIGASLEDRAALAFHTRQIVTDARCRASPSCGPERLFPHLLVRSPYPPLRLDDTNESAAGRERLRRGGDRRERSRAVGPSSFARERGSPLGGDAGARLPAAERPCGPPPPELPLLSRGARSQLDPLVLPFTPSRSLVRRSFVFGLLFSFFLSRVGLHPQSMFRRQGIR